ncbi:MAG: NAD(P)H-dependent glycerol-3-phosphate dehydrogenase, partial [Alphaproteobacteria bacterium]
SCTSPSSRNYALGHALGRGQSLHQATVGGRVLAEGVFTAPAVLARAARAGIEMPICAAVDGVLNRGADIDATIRVLLARPAKAEHAEVEEAPALTRHRRLG